MRLILADTQVLVRAGMRKLIEALSGMQVLAETGDGQQLLELVGQHRPDVVVTEIELARVSGLDAVAQAQRHYPEVRFLILSSQHEARNVRSALKGGARGFLVKDAELPELELALRAVMRGQTWLSPGISHNIVNARRHQRAEESVALTPRQRQVLQLVGRGRSTKEIAGLMGVSTKTVETHRARMMQTLGLFGTNALMRFAIRSGVDGGEL